MQIKIQWREVEKNEFNHVYSHEMIVIESDHPRFTKGTNFDFGFFNIATMEGYEIISLPPVRPDMIKASPKLSKCDSAEKDGTEYKIFIPRNWWVDSNWPRIKLSLWFLNLIWR